MTLAAVLCCSISVSAQDSQEGRNRAYNITLGNVQYTHHDEKLSAGEAVGKVLTGVLTGKTSVQATKYEDDVKSAIIKGLSSAYRFRFTGNHENNRSDYEFRFAHFSICLDYGKLETVFPVCWHGCSGISNSLYNLYSHMYSRNILFIGRHKIQR